MNVFANCLGSTIKTSSFFSWKHAVNDDSISRNHRDSNSVLHFLVSNVETFCLDWHLASPSYFLMVLSTQSLLMALENVVSWLTILFATLQPKKLVLRGNASSQYSSLVSFSLWGAEMHRRWSIGQYEPLKKEFHMTPPVFNCLVNILIVKT